MSVDVTECIEWAVELGGELKHAEECSGMGADERTAHLYPLLAQCVKGFIGALIRQPHRLKDLWELYQLWWWAWADEYERINPSGVTWVHEDDPK